MILTYKISASLSKFHYKVNKYQSYQIIYLCFLAWLQKFKSDYYFKLLFIEEKVKINIEEIKYQHKYPKQITIIDQTRSEKGVLIILSIIQSIKMLERIWKPKTHRKTKQELKQHEAMDNPYGLYNQSPVPSNSICERIIEMQQQIDDGNFTKDDVVKFTQEYTNAIEFYEGIDNTKYKIFQRKLYEFLQKPSVISVLEGKQANGIKVVKKQNVEKQILKANTHNKEQAKKLIQSSQQGALNQKRIIERQMNKQMQSLEKRLEDKRSNSKLRDLKSPNKLSTFYQQLKAKGQHSKNENVLN